MGIIGYAVVILFAIIGFFRICSLISKGHDYEDIQNS